jgi:hypothetical protein
LRSQQSVGKTILLLAGLVVLVAAIRAPMLGIPFERDEGEYAYIGWRLGHNELPYRDWVDQKPPAIFWVYRAALALPLNPIRAVHLAAIVFSAASACGIFFLAQRFTNQFWALGGAAVFAFLSADPLIQGTAANTELFMLLPLILSQIAFFRSLEKPSNTWSIFLSGALTAIAISFKQVAAVNWFLLIALYPVFIGRERRWRDALRFIALSGVGLLTVIGGIAVFFWMGGGLAALTENVITHNLEYVGAMTWSDRLHSCFDTLSTLTRTESLIWVFGLFGLVALLRTGETRWFVFLTGWLITSGIGVSASGYFFPHYFQQLLPPIALAAVASAQGLSETGRSKLISRAALCMLFLVLPIITAWPFWFSYSPADAVRKIYPGNFFAEMPQLASRLGEMTSLDQRVFVFGAEPEVLFYAQRVSATRYIFLFPLYGPYRNVREKQIAAADEIRRGEPAAAVYVPNGLFFSPGTDQYFTEWSLSYFQKNFLPDTWLIKETEDRAGLVPARPDLPPPHNLLGAIFIKKPATQ